MQSLQCEELDCQQSSWANHFNISPSQHWLSVKRLRSQRLHLRDPIFWGSGFACTGSSLKQMISAVTWGSLSGTEQCLRVMTLGILILWMSKLHRIRRWQQRIRFCCHLMVAMISKHALSQILPLINTMHSDLPLPVHLIKLIAIISSPSWISCIFSAVRGSCTSLQ